MDDASLYLNYSNVVVAVSFVCHCPCLDVDVVDINTAPVWLDRFDTSFGGGASD